MSNISLYDEGPYDVGLYGGIGDIPTSYVECLNRIRTAEYASIQLGLIDLLPQLRGNANPIYDYGLDTIPYALSSEVKTALENEIYTFVFVEDTDVFDYCKEGYIESNPGQFLGVYSSYVGIYISQDGEYTDQYGIIEPVYTGNFVISYGGVWNDNGVWKDEEVWVDGD